jgi:hypothetical protein
MSEFNPQPILLRIFNRLRHSGFCLGMSEYLAALQAVEGGYGASNQEELEEVLRLLWCHSLVEQSQFKLLWESVTLDTPKINSEPLLSKPEPEPPPEGVDEPLPSIPANEADTVEPQPSPDLAPLPVRAPSISTEAEDTSELQTYWPVSHRSMVYIWRYLRRPVPDGAEDIVDEKATVEQAARQGFFLVPVYRRRDRNHAHLLLLLDQDGSMTPFHRFTRDLVETAQYESTIEQVEVCYFHNIPAKSVYRDRYLTDPVTLDRVLVACDSDTSVLVVSDAGAARGYRRLERIRATTEVLFQIKQRTNLIAWLNPMPTERWASTSAQIIAHLVHMYQMDNDGLSKAIDIVRGQPLQHYR